MRIRRLTATFGKLREQTLELQDGLNILQAPNETGKSTWCAFLLSMFYGINTKERDRAGFLADKNRYAPWSGAPMSGRLDGWAGEEALSLLRTTRRPAAPMGEFQALYTGTADPVPGLTGANCGDALLGVSREVYARSAFIRQSGVAVSQDPGLERRIAALITSGEEDTSYSEALEALKKQLNRRRHNKTGQLPALEAELQETEALLPPKRTWSGSGRASCPAPPSWRSARPPWRRSWRPWTAGTSSAGAWTSRKPSWPPPRRRRKPRVSAAAWSGSRFPRTT